MTWICIKERMPEPGSEILVKLKYKKPQFAVVLYYNRLVSINGDFRNGVFILCMPPRIKLTHRDSSQFYFEKSKITHWMLLPTFSKITN